LLGGRDRATGRVTFPCPNDRERFDLVELPRTGTLWSWTVQRFRPKSPPYKGPEAFEPYALGYVELPGTVIVETRLTGVDFGALKIGMAMEMTVEPLFTDADGHSVVTYAFTPPAAEKTDV
jgi:uncharacterized OB-fold protein